MKCPEGKIINPATGRCVNITGKIGKKILLEKNFGRITVPKPVPKPAFIPPKPNPKPVVILKPPPVVLKPIVPPTIVEKKPLVSLLECRLKEFQKIKVTMGKHEKECINNKSRVLDQFFVKNRIGSASMAGEVWLACNPFKGKECAKDAMDVAVKIVPNEPKKVDPEMAVLEGCTHLLEVKITPHLPLFYGHYDCNSCIYSNEALIERFGRQGSCNILISEYATGGDLKHWMSTKPSLEELKNLYFQITFALACFQKYFKLYHNDLHWGNVLLLRTRKGGFTQYTIGKKVYMLPNIGLVALLWDFGDVQPLNSRNKSGDLIRISHSVIWAEKEYNISFPKTYEAFLGKFRGTYRWAIKKLLSPQEILETTSIFDDFLSKNNENITDSFTL